MNSIAVQYFAEIKDPCSGNEPARILIHLLDKSSQKQLSILLSRALNTLPPHDPKWKDWFELADALDTAAGNSATAG